MKLPYKAICSILPFFLLVTPILATDNYSYYCINGTSYEHNDNGDGGTTNSVLCSFGCDNSTALTYHEGAVPQADLCSQDPFYSTLEGMGVFVGLILAGVWIYKKVKE
jgi:hypothetical protein